MIGLSGEIPLVSHSDVTSPFPPSGNGGYGSNLDVLAACFGLPCLQSLQSSQSIQPNLDTKSLLSMLFFMFHSTVNLIYLNNNKYVAG